MSTSTKFHYTQTSMFSDLNADIVESVLGEVWLETQLQLQSFASLPEAELLEKFRLAFGDRFEEQAALNIIEDWRNHNWEGLSPIEFVDNTQFRGAFSRETNTIYFSEKLVRDTVLQFETVEDINSDNQYIQAFVAVWLEEIGHSVEAQLNEEEIAGDEGRILAAVVIGESYTRDQLKQWQQEEDQNEIIINNQTINAEFSVVEDDLYGLLTGPVARWGNVNTIGGVNSVETTPVSISGSSELPLVITYSFMTTVPNYYDIDGDSVNVDGNLATLLQPFSEDTTKFIVDALKLYSDIANIQFQEVDETANGGEGGTLNFGYAFLTDQMGMSDAAGLAYTPSSLLEFPYSPNFDKKIGDIWIDRNETNFKPGTDGFFTIIHEIGHALGLEHPHETSDGDQIVGFKDNYEYTIMSYNESKLNPGVFPRTPQILDVAAIQYLYGVNNNTRSGDDIYSWEDNENFMQTIWDTGGNDTISAAKQSNEVTIDLAAGYANIGLNNKTYKPARSNLQIPVNVIIENIKGGQGDDTLIGNNIDNRLEGNGGNDTLEGNGGNDFIDGGEGEDTAIFSDAPQNYDYEVIDNNQIKIIHARGSESVQTDILINIENLNFLDTNLTVHTLTAQKFYQATNQQGKVADLLKHNSGSIFQQIIDFLVTYLVRLMVHLAVLIVVLVH